MKIHFYATIGAMFLSLFTGTVLAANQLDSEKGKPKELPSPNAVAEKPAAVSAKIHDAVKEQPGVGQEVSAQNKQRRLVFNPKGQGQQKATN